MTSPHPPEITFKAIFLGIVLSIILAGANAYLGLFAGMTVSASIPAAVISMGVLRLFRKSNILENTLPISAWLFIFWVVYKKTCTNHPTVTCVRDVQKKKSLFRFLVLIQLSNILHYEWEFLCKDQMTRRVFPFPHFRRNFCRFFNDACWALSLLSIRI